MLQDQFRELAQLLTLYGDDNLMRDTAVIRCKANLEFYVWDKANLLIASLSE